MDEEKQNVVDMECEGNDECEVLKRMLRYNFSEADLAHVECR